MKAAADLHALGERGRWLVLIGSDLVDPASMQTQFGLRPTEILVKADLPISPASIRALVREAGIDCAAIITDAWMVQPMPQLLEFALLCAPVRERWLLESRGSAHRLSLTALAGTLATLPAAGAVATVQAAATAARSLRRPARKRRDPRQAKSSMLGVWVNVGSSVGGAVTHLSGIMGGFAGLGLYTAMVTTNPIPSQLSQRVDCHQLVGPLPPRVRLTSDLYGILINKYVLSAARRVASSVTPAFVYQRHRPFLVAGLHAARAAGVPFVLEFNNSEAWAREHWNTPRAIERGFDPLLRYMERFVLEQADLVIAVSSIAAEVAEECGAEAGRVAVVPNAVDLQLIDRAIGASDSSEPQATVGWIGTFGPWHGAEVIVQALAHLPENVTALMIGDGSTRRACIELADRLGLSGRIEWTGRLAHDEALMRLARCAVLASPHVPFRDQRFFGSPTKLFEYMALGLPVVASRLEQLAEILEDGTTAVLVEPGNATDLARGIREVLGRPDRGAALGLAAREAAEQRHTWKRRAEDIVGELGRVSGGADFR